MIVRLEQTQLLECRRQRRCLLLLESARKILLDYYCLQIDDCYLLEMLMLRCLLARKTDWSKHNYSSAADRKMSVTARECSQDLTRLLLLARQMIATYSRC